MGWLLCIIGILGIVADGGHLSLESVVTQAWTLPVIVAGLVILLLKRNALAYWAALMVGGGWLYLASTTYLDTGKWIVDGEILAFALVLCGILFSARTIAVNDVRVLELCLLGLVVWGALLWSQQDGLEYENVRELVTRYHEHLPRVSEIALASACMLGTIWVLHRLRSENIAIRAHLVMSAGLLCVATELAWSWAAPFWRSQVLLIGGVLAILGLATYLVSCFAQKRYMVVIFVSLLIGIGGMVALTTWQVRLQATALHLELANIFMIGMILVAAAAMTTGFVDGVFSTTVDDDWILPSLFVKTSIAAWIGIAATVLTLVSIAKFEMSSFGSGMLTLLAAAGCMLFFLSLWAAVLLIADMSIATAIPENAGLLDLWLTVAIKGPRDFGYGPSLAFGGIVLIAVLGILPEWGVFPFLRLVAAALLIVGLTSMSSSIMCRIQEANAEKYAADPTPHRLEHMANQVRLVPIGVAAGATAVTLMFVVTADIWLLIRIVLALLTSVGFVVAAIPLLYALAAPPLRRLDITLNDLSDWYWFAGWPTGSDMLKALRTTDDSTTVARLFANGSAIGLCVGVLSIVFSAAFELYVVLEMILVGVAVLGIASTLAMGWLMFDRISFIEAGDLLARTRSFTHSKRSTFRLLPEFQQVGSDDGGPA
ncbi:hypothetical protein FXF51_17965 [Nonomuraea sp. PA05]|uniref:hypothetical protein n=1 Tax=Nonomuraea sp. PA05 TaxID=2604466 RepID=UPI0011D8A577|nr:hypothetical protein [Nonomuraea sp. PA05]TYB66081.1 hypothetical protein FXF51_17965 [Nonomuraea sp. PA05]